MPIEDQIKLEKHQHPSRDEEIQVFHPTFIQSSHFATNFPIVGLAALPPAPNALGGDIFAIGSPKHHLFRDALADDVEEIVPVSILRMRPFYYIFNRTIKGTEKIYYKDDPRLKSGTREDPHGEPERKRWWEATTVWTGVDFGAGPGSVAVKDAGDKVIVLGVGGGILFRELANYRQERGVGDLFCEFGKGGCDVCLGDCPLIHNVQET